MGTLSARGKSTAMAANAAAATKAALFNATGTEITGGTPAYARKVITWGTESAGSIPLAGTLPYEFDVPAGAVVAEIRYMEGDTSEYQGSEAVTPNETFGAQGVFELTAGSLTVANPA